MFLFSFKFKKLICHKLHQGTFVQGKIFSSGTHIIILLKNNFYKYVYFNGTIRKETFIVLNFITDFLIHWNILLSTDLVLSLVQVCWLFHAVKNIWYNSMISKTPGENEKGYMNGEGGDLPLPFAVHTCISWISK